MFVSKRLQKLCWGWLPKSVPLSSCVSFFGKVGYPTATRRAETMFGLRRLWHLFLSSKINYNWLTAHNRLSVSFFEEYMIYQRSWYTIYSIYGDGMQWVCIFLAFRTVSKAGMFDFGETHPQNRQAQHTFKGHIPGWARYFETYPCNPIMYITYATLQLISYIIQVNWYNSTDTIDRYL